MEKIPYYLVPYDFTAVSDQGLDLALMLAKKTKGKIHLLHVIKGETPTHETMDRFERHFKDLSDEDRGYINFDTSHGDLFDVVGNVAKLRHASLIIMGTNGAIGMQKVFGSHSVKFITHSTVPILLTQGLKDISDVKNIVIPFSYDKETVQIAVAAGLLAIRCKATVHLVGFHTDDEYTEGHTRSNEHIIRKLLEPHGIECKSVKLERKDTYEHELIQYAVEINADVIAATYFKKGILPSMNLFLQMMIENDAHIPVLTVNSGDPGFVASNLSFMQV